MSCEINRTLYKILLEAKHFFPTNVSSEELSNPKGDVVTCKNSTLILFN